MKLPDDLKFTSEPRAEDVEAVVRRCATRAANVRLKDIEFSWQIRQQIKEWVLSDFNLEEMTTDEEKSGPKVELFRF